MKSLPLLITLFLISLGSSAQWTILNSNTTYQLNGVHFISDQQGMAVADSGRTTSTLDGGNTWTAIEAIPGCNLKEVFFISADSGWIASSCGIHVTTDGGQSWSLQSSAGGQEMHDVFFINAQVGWAVGNNMTYLLTTDGGTNWSFNTLNTTVPNNPLLTVFFHNASDGWIGGGVRMHFTNDGGQTWNQGSIALLEWIHDLDFSTPLIGVGAGMSGAEVSTTDGGTNWDFSGFVTPSFEDLNGVSFSSTDSVYMVGNDGLIYFANDGGVTWTLQASGISETLRAVDFPSADWGFAVGDGGRIIRYGVPISVEENMNQEKPVLYPNPATNRVQIGPFLNSANGSTVEIMVTDLLGHQIIQKSISIQSGKTSVDLESLSAGTYLITTIHNKEVNTLRLVKQD